MINLKSWPKKWNDVSDKWNDASLSRLVDLPQFSRSRPWPMLGMLALGLVAGVAIGGYAVSRRSHMKRLASYAHRMGDELDAMGETDDAKPVAEATSRRSDHRPKAGSKV